jgi:hypothetical protein
MGRIVLVGALTLSSAVAMAGLVQPVPVTVTLNADGSGAANGAMTTARFSTDTVQYIGCGVRKFDDGAGGVTTYGFCQASDDKGNLGFCSTENVALLEALQSISAYSFITFAWRADGTCRTIGNSTQSFYIP